MKINLKIDPNLLMTAMQGFNESYKDAFLNGQLTQAKFFKKTLLEFQTQIRKNPGLEHYCVFDGTGYENKTK